MDKIELRLRWAIIILCSAGLCWQLGWLGVAIVVFFFATGSLAYLIYCLVERHNNESKKEGQ